MHIPVLLKQSIKSLKIIENGVYIDATFGSGAHTKAILNKLNFHGKLYALDKDPNSINIAKKIQDHRFTFISDSFSNIKKYCKKLNIIKKVNGILLDLGISSIQLDDPNRGFSFKKDGPLDMRINQKNGLSAAQLLMQSKKEKIQKILKKYGEERFSKKIAYNIDKQNKIKPILKTSELYNLILKSTPYQKKNPARRSFQAIRIYLNNELKELKNVLSCITKILSIGGILSVISFHSLEDKIIKKFLFQNSQKIPNIPKNIPLTYQELKKMNKNKRKFKIFKKIFPTKKEILKNSRCRSAILRSAKLIHNS
ncbi:16S rRNA (cytosine(1402)-N(4))-methyltransferase RsmH [Buchnera aphidicola]|uniref:16S rRNA (cytosine(1402)-N(4))-methyltransferase RsmH n=1 Tax=Buchnera aphidicola TaxID=9 RepID=UPI0022371B91|nr:16S rRNA (cytosine(1402)-N(4))-methyltransferase RsmH [Buchnera aphidicola]MCW5197761.1 16S rRNA (cytosine(1402)-N(4))-methyltransferase RsmH [Buchnera aphidicola (Chaitophorus viminalis)]